MDAQSQITKSGQYTQICNSCRRNLNLSHFGTLWNGRSGFNLTCKVCRQQAQKKHFAKTYQRKQSLRAKVPSFIASLDQQNHTVLKSSLTLESTVAIEIEGVSVLTGSPCRATLEVIGRRTSRRLRLQLWVAGDERPFTLESCTSNIESFIRCSLMILREQSVRLHTSGSALQAEASFLSELAPAA